jgi:UDP:flavonoid glycosyltransferase YjiC (YdhE family)
LLSAASLLDGRGHEVTVLASGETHDAAARLGLGVTGYRRSPDPDSSLAFEAQAEEMMATMAGAEIALDARDALVDVQPDLAVVDCMLPAAIAAARATGTPTASLVHFLYGLARTQMRRVGGGWTQTFAASRRPIACSGSPPQAMASAPGKPPRCCWSPRLAGSTSTVTHRHTWCMPGPWASVFARGGR